MWGKKNVWKDEEEAHKDGRNMSYRDEVEARELSQSKECKKVGLGQKWVMRDKKWDMSRKNGKRRSIRKYEIWKSKNDGVLKS